MRERDGGTPRRPCPETRATGPGREEGRSRLCHLRRHPHPRGPGRPSPPSTRASARARDEPAGHRISGRRHPVGVRRASGSVHDKKAEWVWSVLGELKPAWSPWPTRATRAAPGRRSRTGERTSPDRSKKPTAPTQTRRAGRAGERAAQVMENPQQAGLLPWRAGNSRKPFTHCQLPRSVTQE